MHAGSWRRCIAALHRSRRTPNRTEGVMNMIVSLLVRNEAYQRVFSTADVHCAQRDVMRVQQLFCRRQLIARDIATAFGFA